jgi:hypothetical protein
MTASGATTDVCGLATTTCDAYLVFRNPVRSCSGDSTPSSAHDDECGISGVADGLCRHGVLGNLCTYPCLAPVDCATTCVDDDETLTAGDKYCSL